MRRGRLVLLPLVVALSLSGFACPPATVDWTVVVDPDRPEETLPRALLGHYDLSGALFAYDQVPGLVPLAEQAGIAGADWRIGLGRWEAATRLLPTATDGTPCPIPTPAAAAPPGATDLDLIAARDWFVDDGLPVTLADVADDGRYALDYVREAADVALSFGARPFLSVDLMPRALAANRAPLRDDCLWSYQNRVSNVRPADPDVFAAALTGVVSRLVLGSAGEPGRPVPYVEIWNEPELPIFWDPSFEDLPGPLDRFFGMAIRALVQLDAWRAAQTAPDARDLRIGLGSFASHQTAVTVLGGFDQATLPTASGRIPLDFISFHAYDHDPLVVVGAIEAVAAAAAATNGYRDVELVLAEWGPNLQQAGADPLYARTMAPALHIASVIALGAAAGLDRAHHSILWDFYPNDLIKFGIVDHAGAPKPAHRAYELLSHVVDGRAVRLAPGLAADGRLGDEGSVLVSRGEDGAVRMLFVNRGATPRTARAQVLGRDPIPDELSVFDDPEAPIRHAALPEGPSFTVPAESLVLVVYR